MGQAEKKDVKLPNFLIVGAAKAGTTSLFDYLDSTEDIFLSHPKEPKYFTRNVRWDMYSGPGDRKAYSGQINNFSDYCALFKKAQGAVAIGEASADYLYYHQISIAEIKQYLKDPQIFIILRNPIDRAYSAYKHLVIRGRESESFERALKLEEERKQKHYEFIWYLKDTGLYYEQVKDFIESFSNAHVFVFEDWLKDFGALANEVRQYLGLDAVVWPNIIRSNVSGIPKYKILNSFFKGRFFYKIQSVKKKYFCFLPNTNLVSSFLERNISNPPMNRETRKALANFFYDDVKRLSDLLGRDLVSFWLSE